MAERKRNHLDVLDGRVVVPRETPLPPAPPGVRYVKAPFRGIIIADDQLRETVRRHFHWPMIILALLILPLLAIEVVRTIQKNHADEVGILFDPHWIDWVTMIAFSIIWLAFLIEFICKIAIAECRIEYVKRNWLDVIIIAIPLLRPLRIATVAKTTRVFTLRGVGMKFARYVFTFIIGLEATDRFLERFGLKSRRDRKNPGDMTRHELMKEVSTLRSIRDEWEQWYDDEQTYLTQRGFDPFTEKPTPELDPPPPKPSGEENELPGQVELDGGASST